MRDPCLIAVVEFTFENGELFSPRTIYRSSTINPRKDIPMANLNDLKQAIIDTFANAEEGLSRAATVTQAAADALKAMASGQGVGENPMVQELIDLVKADGADLIDRANALTDALAGAIPHAEAP